MSAASRALAFLSGTLSLVATSLAHGEVPVDGVAVVAMPGAQDVAWTAAKDVYADDLLRPSSIDEASARAIVGDPIAPNAPASVRELAEEQADLHGEDAASRAILRTMADRLHVRVLVVVRLSPAGALARIFLPTQATFDAASYQPDATPSTVNPQWHGLVGSLDRMFGPQTQVMSLATKDVPAPKARSGESKPFYRSPWFWIAAAGAAACAGAFLYLESKDSSVPSTGNIQLQLDVSR
jgi:hypothetical protein